MKKLLFSLVIASAGLAHAEWTRVSAVADHSLYIDRGTVKRKGSIVAVWTLRDHNTAQPFEGTRYWSDKVFAEVDCKEDMIAFRYVVIVAGKMGNGTPLRMLDYSNEKSRPIVPDSVLDTLKKVVCALP